MRENGIIPSSRFMSLPLRSASLMPRTLWLRSGDSGIIAHTWA